MLVTKELNFSYSNKTKLAFPDLKITSGEHWLLIGNSGSGKTTLLHLLAGLRSPMSGEIQLQGTVINKLSPAQLDKFRGQHIGIIFQESHFIRALTIGENLSLARKLAGLAPNEDLVKSLLARLNISDKINDRPRELSVGERQRAAIARALVNEPAIIFADEPTSALDDENTEVVIQLLKDSAKAAGATLLIITHDQRLKTQFENRVEL